MASTPRRPRKGARKRKVAEKPQRQTQQRKKKLQTIGGLADYSIGDVIGRGLVGPVRRGRYLPTGASVAMEEIPEELRNDRRFVGRLGKAGKRAAKLRDRSLVPVYDLLGDAKGGSLYLITDLAEGSSLATLAPPRSGLSRRAAATVVDGMLAALEALHQAGQTHGGLSRETLLIAPDGRVRLAGLGIAGILSTPDGNEPDVTGDLQAAARLGLELLTDPVEGSQRKRRVPRRLATTLRTELTASAQRKYPTATEFRGALEIAARRSVGDNWRSRSSLATLVADSTAARASGIEAAPPAPTRADLERRRRPLRQKALLAGGVVVVPIVGGAAVALAFTDVLSPATAPGPLSVRDVAMSVWPGQGGCDKTFTFTATGDVHGAGVLVYRWNMGKRSTGDVRLPVKSTDAGFSVSQAWRPSHDLDSPITMVFQLVKPVRMTITRTLDDPCG